MSGENLNQLYDLDSLIIGIWKERINNDDMKSNLTWIIFSITICRIFINNFTYQIHWLLLVLEITVFDILKWKLFLLESYIKIRVLYP